MKCCADCKATKTPEEFKTLKNGKLYSYCVPCELRQYAGRRVKNAERGPTLGPYLCKPCGRLLPREAFNASKGSIWGVFHWCKECAAKRVKARVKGDPLGATAQEMLGNAKRRAKVLGLPFDLTREDIQIPSHCPALGIPLSRNSVGMKDSSPSLDRLVPELGYVKGNVAVISYRANRIKTDATELELERVLEWVKSRV